MTTLAEHIIVAGAENRPPMLEKSMYDSWASRIRLFIKGKKNGRMMLDSIDNGPLVYPIVEENRQTRPKIYSKLTKAQQLQDDCDVQATNIILHGLPPFQVNTKFLNALPSEWSKFVTDVKLAKSLYTTNYDQLYAYLTQHEQHANEVCIMRERYSNPLTLVANSQTLYNPSHSPQHSVSLFLHFRKERIQLNVSIKQWHSYLLWHQGFHLQTINSERLPILEIRNRVIATTSRGNYAAGQAKIVKCYNCLRERHMVKQCTQPKRPRSSAWFKEKLMLAEAQEAFMLAEAQEAGQILDEEQLAFLADPGISEAPVAHWENDEFNNKDVARFDKRRSNAIMLRVGSTLYGNVQRKHLVLKQDHEGEDVGNWLLLMYLG
ncbi:copia protein [Tanacetum coccineum]